MNAVAPSTAGRRPPLSMLERTTMGIYVLIILALLYEQFGLFKGLFPPIGLIQMLVVLPALVAFAVRSRWLLLVSSILIALDLLFNLPYIVGDLSQPANVGPFVFTALSIPLLLAALVLSLALFFRKLPARG